jgi:hypothetical protein
MFCSAIYFVMTLSVAFPELQQKDPRARDADSPAGQTDLAEELDCE